MARKKVLDIDADKTLAFEKPGQSFSGYYIGNKTITTEFGPGLLHVFQTDDGTVGLYGSSKLDSKLATVTPGHMTYITFQGKVKIPGGKTMKKFDVEWDDEDSINLAGTVVNYSNSEDESEQAESSNEDEINEEDAAAEDDNSEETEDGEIVQTAPKSSSPKTISKPKSSTVPAANVSRVNSLLSKKR